MAKNISAARSAELVLLAEESLNQRDDWFDYFNWDSLIECDRTMSPDELRWLEENFTVEVRLMEKSR